MHGGAPGRHCGYITPKRVVRCLQISPGVAPHLPAEVVVGGWLRHREPCRRNRLFSSCLPWERHLTPPQTWMHRSASSCPPLCSPCRFAAHPSARYRLDKSKAAQRPSVLCGCYLWENCPELPFGHCRSVWEVDGALHGQRHPGNPGVALMRSVTVRLDRSAWTGEAFAPSSCSVLGVAFSSSC